jgi:hypothetical protein
MKIEGDRDKMIDTMYNIVMPDVKRKLCNMLPSKFDELMNSSQKYNRYISILNKSFETYKTKIKYVYFITISKCNKVYLTCRRGREVKAGIPHSSGVGRRGFDPRQLRRTKHAFFPPLAI